LPGKAAPLCEATCEIVHVPWKIAKFGGVS
jgi:hypothetical protein